MIRILCQGGEEETRRVIAQDLRTAYDLPVPPEVLSDDAVWTGPPEWNDVLLVVYRSTDVPESTRVYIQVYRAAHALTDPRTNQRRPGGVVLPIAMDPGARRPPDPISGIKALLYDELARGPSGRLTRWVGVFLGITLRCSEHQIFISYRAQDGSVIAQDLYRRLESRRLPPLARRGRREHAPRRRGTGRDRYACQAGIDGARGRHTRRTGIPVDQAGDRHGHR